MKRISIILIVLIGLFAIASCDKNNDPDNYFSYAGKNYTVDSTYLAELVFNQGTADQLSLFQFVFTSISGPDTTSLLIAVFDTLSNTLSGNYPAIDQLAVDNNSRAIFPYGFFFGSAIALSTGNAFFTGKGGSIDISVTDGKYTIKMNDISAGVYSDIFDDNGDGKSGYTETGKIGGFFKGNLTKVTQSLSKKSAISNPLLNRLIQVHNKKISK
jgi:hypothetical protein